MARRPRARDAWERGLAQAGTPAFLLNAHRRLMAWNAGCELLTGWVAAELLGQQANYASVPDFESPEAILNAICPPVEVFAGTATEMPVFLPARDGRTEARLLQFHPLADSGGSVTAVLGIVSPLPPPQAAQPVSPVQQLHADLAGIRVQLRERWQNASIVCKSPLMTRVLAQVELAQHSAVPVFLRGEPGTGREHVARVIHFGSPHKANWFVPLDCRRLGPEELQRVLEGLIEVHQKGAPSAGRPQPGTLYLVDVECLPRDLQAIVATAFVAPRQADGSAIRLMASGNRPLEEAVAADLVRPDLHALLTPLCIDLPPLRQRSDELPLLAQHFLEEANRLGKKQLSGFAPATLPLFAQYSWPGNLDELQLVIREAHARAAETLIRPDDLPFRFRTGLEQEQLPPAAEMRPLPLDELLTRAETNLIQLALERGRYNKSKAAEILGINRARLYRRMEQLGIEDREGGGSAPAPSVEV